MVALYLDDIRYSGTMRKFEQTIQAVFKIKTTHMAKECIGRGIETEPEHIKLHHRHHIESALKKFSMQQANPVSTQTFGAHPDNTGVSADLDDNYTRAWWEC